MVLAMQVVDIMIKTSSRNGQMSCLIILLSRYNHVELILSDWNSVLDGPLNS
jgi:hypothetical protein